MSEMTGDEFHEGAAPDIHGHFDSLSSYPGIMHVPGGGAVTMSSKATKHVIPSAIGGDFSTFVASYVSVHNKESRRRLVARFFDLTADPEAGSLGSGQYCREDLLVELLEEAATYAEERGFPCAEMSQFLELYLHCLEMLGDETTNLATVAKQFKDTALQYSSRMSHSTLLFTISYITETIFQHHHLYQFLLTQEQPVDLTLLDVTIETAIIPQSLSCGVSAEEWERRERIRELENAHAAKEKEQAEMRELVLHQEKLKLQKAYHTQLTKLETTPDISEEEVSEVIDSLAKTHLESTMTSISQEIKKQELDVDFQVQRLEIVATPTSGKDSQTPAAGDNKSGKVSRASKSPSKK